MKNNTINVHKDVPLPIDNWTQCTSYKNTRILDAIADLLWLKSPCSATVFNKDSGISWSLNNTITKSESTRFNTLLTLFNQSNNAHDLLSIHLFSNINLIEIIKNQNNKDKTNYQYSDNWKKYLETYRNTKDYYIKNIKTLDTEYLKKELATLRDFYLVAILKDKYLLNIDREFAEDIFRPLQDCYKILYFYKNLSSVKIDHIPNPLNLHAENNLFHDLNEEESVYYGTSKLSCGYCHERLGKDKPNHRGSHGRVDGAWNTSGDKDKLLVARVEKNVIEVDYAPKQTRKLSFDDFEEEIFVTLNGEDNNVEIHMG